MELIEWWRLGLLLWVPAYHQGLQGCAQKEDRFLLQDDLASFLDLYALPGRHFLGL